MQSFLQYRRFGRQVQAQLERDREKASALNNGTRVQPRSGGSSGEDTVVSDSNRDVEKGEEQGVERGISNGRRESAESHQEQQEERTSTGSPGQTEALYRQQTEGTNLGQTLTGVDVRDRKEEEGGDQDRQVFVVGFEGDKDLMNPHNWSLTTRIVATMWVALIGAVVGLASSVDSETLQRAANDFHVAPVVESLATGLYLVGFGAGALFAGPLSETVGRNPIYISTLLLYMIFIMASALAPNIGAQLAFRFLAGFFGSTPLTCAGGSVADMWNPLERVYAFPVFANAAFLGPVLGPVIGGFIAETYSITWRWTEWVTLIASGFIWIMVVLFQPETYPAILLKWKSKHLRRLTGDDRYLSVGEVKDEGFGVRLRRALTRPFILTVREPIIMLIALYLTVIYIVLFTFLDGYDYIFGMTYGVSKGITGLCFVGIIIGLFFASALVPLIYHWAKRDLRKLKEETNGKKSQLPPEDRLWFAMLGGSIAIPISLFWMGWTAYPHISIWSPLAASVFFGYGILCVFISSYLYIIDSYESFSASALASVTLIRYFAAGGMVVVGVPFYQNLGVHYTLTILGCISALLAPLPFVFYKAGPGIRKRSKFAVNDE